jgi:hypothetical protein
MKEGGRGWLRFKPPCDFPTLSFISPFIRGRKASGVFNWISSEIDIFGKVSI